MYYTCLYLCALAPSQSSPGALISGAPPSLPMDHAASHSRLKSSLGAQPQSADEEALRHLGPMAPRLQARNPAEGEHLDHGALRRLGRYARPVL